MIVFPAIDLVAGKVVRLERGDRSRMKVYSENPAAVARDFVEQGATWLHVVDLSAAFEEDEAAREANSKAIAALCQVEGISIDVGGGVRSLERIDELARLGAKRIAMGTVLVRDESFAQAAVAQFGELLVADVAAKAGQVKVNGWREDVGASADEVVGRLSRDSSTSFSPISRAMACRRASMSRHIATLPRLLVFPWLRRAAFLPWPISRRSRRRATASSRAALPDARFTRAHSL